MKMRVFAAVAIAIPMAMGTSRLMAQGNSGRDNVHVPDSSIEQPGDRGQKAHTNHVIAPRRDGAANGMGPGGGMSPDQIRAAYNVPGVGGAGTIAIVDAFDYPNALNDFNAFSQQFNLPKETGDGSHFQVAYPKGRPRANCGWAQEAALDIEWAHAMAPGAKIVLVLAKSNSFADLFAAVNYAETLPGVTQISMSWGGSEFASETSYDSTFSSNNVSYFAASGDTGGVTIYPGVSPNVVSAGGTSLTMNDLTFVSETGWSGSGGGPSKYEPKPAFQNVIASLGSKRGVPDFSFDADPYTGVSVYDSYSCQGLSGWLVFGGTSVSSPALAGIVNNAGNHQGANELSYVYSGYPDAYNTLSPTFRDVKSGTAGGNQAGTGWDFVTGIGSSLGTVKK